VSPGRELRAVDWQLEDAGFVVEAAGGLEGVSFVFFAFFAGFLGAAFATQVFLDSHFPVWHASLGSQNPTT
tara:strand:- start:27137 stop:27349 length:213 start_codon:yes stop_codon:yes gene_type:complete